jgi:hypothetical protein
MHAPGWSERQTIQLGARIHFFSGGFIMLPRNWNYQKFCNSKRGISKHLLHTWLSQLVNEVFSSSKKPPRCMAQTTSRETKAQGTQLDRLH